MTTSEYTLEENLIKTLIDQGYTQVNLADTNDLKQNFKQQLELHNKKTNLILTDSEFESFYLSLLDKSKLEKSKILQHAQPFTKENGEIVYIELMNVKEWCRNTFQVSNQITERERYETRYDVTILINGLPLVQIELKRAGIEIKEAFRQIQRYHKYSYQGLFQFIQLFIISNRANTRYYSNNPTLPFEQTFCWTDEKNNKINDLFKFATIFLERCHLAKMISKYIVVSETTKSCMILRPYQYYAVEKIIKQVDTNPNVNGYIWHTTGSGKTLTSFKTSQLLTSKSDIYKVVFVVDRKDLDYQTAKEFNIFEKDSVDETTSSHNLVSKLITTEPRLIITTIQKLNNAVTNARYTQRIDHIKDKKIIFIFDECHRTQFGDTHDNIKKYFTNKQFFGFTGTPIFADNNINSKTTEDLFGKKLHTYVLPDAIADKNVLPFAIDYYRTFSSKALVTADNKDKTYEDLMKVEGINTQEVYNHPKRLETIVDFIIKNHNSKTYHKTYTAMFAVSSISTLLEYYKLFKSKDHNLKIATIFSYGANEDLTQKDSDLGTIPDDSEKSPLKAHSKEELDNIVKDYNEMFNERFDLSKENSFNAYYKDISKKVKNKNIDILIVVNMFLTGFDSKFLNTLYVDKNLRYHGLIQAFSRANRIADTKKANANIVCFRNLKENTDQAVKLFSDDEANRSKVAEIIKPTYDETLSEFNKHMEQVITLYPSCDDIDNIKDEKELKAFVFLFRKILTLFNTLHTYHEFTYDDLSITEYEFESYKTKYIDLKDRNDIKGDDGESIVHDLDFQLELIASDLINVHYIIQLLSNLDTKKESYEEDKRKIFTKIQSTPELRDKEELIRKFVDKNNNIKNQENLEDTIRKFFASEKAKEINKIIQAENLDAEKIKHLIKEYEYSNIFNIEELSASLDKSLKYKARSEKRRILTEQIKALVKKFAFEF